MTTASTGIPIEVGAPPRLWVFCPEEPEKIVFSRQGRPLRFTHGRLDTGRNQITLEEVRYFADVEMQDRAEGRRPRYLVTDNPREPLFLSELQDRVLRMVGRRAHAGDFVRIMEEARLEIALMLADDNGVADTANMPLTMTAVTRQHPSMKAALAAVGQRTTPAQAEALERDRMVIERSVAQQGNQDEDDVAGAKLRMREDAGIPSTLPPPPAEAKAPEPVKAQKAAEPKVPPKAEAKPEPEPELAAQVLTGGLEQRLAERAAQKSQPKSEFDE